MKGKWEEAAAALHTAAAGTQAVGAVPVQGGAAEISSSRKPHLMPSWLPRCVVQSRMYLP